MNPLSLLFDARNSSNVMGETGSNTRSVMKQHIHPIITVFLYLASFNGAKQKALLFMPREAVDGKCLLLK